MAKGPATRGDGGRSAPGKDDNRAGGMGESGSGYSPGASGKAPARSGGIADISQAVAQRSGVNKAASDGMITAMAAMAPRQPNLAGTMATPANAYVPSLSSPAAGASQIPQTLQDIIGNPAFTLNPEDFIDAMPQGQLRSDAERYLSTAPGLGYAIAPDIRGTAAGMYGGPAQPVTLAGTRNVASSGMNPANAYVPTPTAPVASMGGFPHAQGIAGANDPYAYSNMPGRVPGAGGAAPSMGAPVNLQQGAGFAPSGLPAVGGPAAPVAPRAGSTQVSPSTSPYEFQYMPETVSPDMFQYSTAGQGVTRGVTSPAAPPSQGSTPAPQPTQISAQDIAQNTAATAGGTPIEYRAGVIPSSVTMPGVGLMSGIQQGIGAVRDLFSGDRQLFGEDGMFPADSRDPETRAADWFAEQEAMKDEGYDAYVAANADNTVPDEGPPTPVPGVTNPFVPPATVPYPYPVNPTPFYNSYADLQAAIGMAGGGQVQAGMTNGFAPGTYYARYNPHMRGLGGLRRG